MDSNTGEIPALPPAREVELIKVITKTEGNHRRYLSWDGELLFEAIFEPANFFNSWFARLQKVTFLVNQESYEITSTTNRRTVEVTQGFRRVGYLENCVSRGYCVGLKFRWHHDKSEIEAITPEGLVTSSRSWRCTAPSGEILFESRPAGLGELFDSWKTFSKALGTVGTIAPARKHDPAIAILFMYMEMFFPRGAAEGA